MIRSWTGIGILFECFSTVSKEIDEATTLLASSRRVSGFLYRHLLQFARLNLSELASDITGSLMVRARFRAIIGGRQELHRTELEWWPEVNGPPDEK